MADVLTLGPSWEPVRVPPLRSDIERRSRAYRRSLRRVQRTGWFALASLLGFAAGAFAALPPQVWA